MSRPTTLGALKREIAAGRVARRPVRSELRENLLARLKAGGPIFPGVLGYVGLRRMVRSWDAETVRGTTEDPGGGAPMERDQTGRTVAS